MESKSKKSPQLKELRGFFTYLAGKLAETKGFEPLMRLNTPYSLSRGAPSATRSRFLLIEIKLYYLTTCGSIATTSFQKTTVKRQN